MGFCNVSPILESITSRKSDNNIYIFWLGFLFGLNVLWFLWCKVLSYPITLRTRMQWVRVAPGLFENMSNWTLLASFCCRKPWPWQTRREITRMSDPTILVEWVAPQMSATELSHFKKISSLLLLACVLLLCWTTLLGRFGSLKLCCLASSCCALWQVISVDLAKQLLENRPGSRALVISMEWFG